MVLKLWYSCHLWYFDQKIVALFLYFYLTLLTQRCKGNDTQADKSQNHCTYIVQNVHCICTLLFVPVMILTFVIKIFAYLEYYCDCENLFWKYHKIYKYIWSNQSNACEELKSVQKVYSNWIDRLCLVSA